MTRNSGGKLQSHSIALPFCLSEVALGKPYNGTCDTYSFCLVLWQMLALTTPFELYTIKRLKERVWSAQEKRPLVGDTWSANIKLLLKKGWANDLNTRFTMAQVEGILKKECIRVRGGDANGLEHHRRRSTFVFRDAKTNEKNSAARKASITAANANIKAMKNAKGADPLSSQSERGPRVVKQSRVIEPTYDDSGDISL